MPYKLATYKHDRFPLSSTCPASTFAWGSPRPLKYTRPLPFPPCDTVLPDRDNPRDPFDRPSFTSFRFRSSMRSVVVRKTWRMNVVIALDRVLVRVSRGDTVEGTDEGEKGREDSSRRMEKRNERRPSTGQVENARPTRTRLTRAGHLDPSPLPHPIRISLSSPVSRSERIDSSMLAVARSKRPRTILWEIESGHAVFAVGRAYIFSLREIYERTAS